jgi:hypothetical protein
VINANLVISSSVAMDAWMPMLPPAVAQFVDTNIFFKELGNFSAKNM